MLRSFVVFASVALGCGSFAVADSNSKSLRPLVEASTPVAFDRPSSIDLYVDQAKAIFRSTEVAGDFLNLAIEHLASLRPSDDKTAKDAYYLIHLLRWKDPQQAVDPANPTAEPGFSLKVDAQNWYIYHRGTWSSEDFSSRNRLYGAKTVYLLYAELNVPAGASIRPIYTLKYVEKTADNVNHLLSLLSLFLPSTTAGGAVRPAEKPTILWGGGRFENIKAPSDVTVSVVFEPGTPIKEDAKPTAGTSGESDRAADSTNSGSNAASGPAITVSAPPAKPVAAAAASSDSAAVNTSPTFDNEGRYWWDVSVAVPIRKISQTTIDTTAGTISAKDVNKQNAFAALDLYPWRVDTKRKVNYLVPHFVGGVAIASQPLHRILLAAGFGPAFANFYVGTTLVKQPQVPSGMASGTGASVGSSFSPQFAFGINLQVKAFQSAVSKTK